ncbi:uncharacterized protein BJ212DRAFT_1304281 [Suillus subaureus]|uniref:Uncharacterized protein n=1 Tax=Suillus subaureus TaxID=48587 RepID=A0A9P7J628_9AGAM|nr:uncharacterized protein BJ212DRAFT_1304281 [Suillus subaureus]KAG1804391.1 hypothetical protein BJ212DRAFT_1304281 [Suillus subaureus]
MRRMPINEMRETKTRASSMWAPSLIINLSWHNLKASLKIDYYVLDERRQLDPELRYHRSKNNITVRAVPSSSKRTLRQIHRAINIDDGRWGLNNLYRLLCRIVDRRSTCLVIGLEEARRGNAWNAKDDSSYNSKNRTSSCTHGRGPTITLADFAILASAFRDNTIIQPQTSYY